MNNSIEEKNKELFRILKRVDKFHYQNFEVKEIVLNSDNFIYSNFKDEIKILYSKNYNDDDSKYLHYFLNDGIKEKDLDIFNFFINNLKIFYGFYTFIDPYNLDEKEPKPPIYLWGNESEFKPNFQLRWLLAKENNNYISPNQSFFHFYLSLNQYLRQNITFSEQDYVKIFNFKAYENKRNRHEKKKDFLYIPSSEIDHCILQYLSLYIKENYSTKLSPNTELRFNILNLFDQELLQTFFTQFQEQEALLNINISNIFFEISKESILIKSVNNKPSETFQNWLISFGYLFNDNIPTPRFRAAMEYFYFLLKDLQNQKNTNPINYHPPSQYLDLITDNKTYEYKILNFESSIFFKRYSELLQPDATKEYWLNKSSEFWQPIFNSYFTLLFSWNETDKNQNNLKCWQQRCRFGVFSHFFQRCLINSFEAIETTNNRQPYFEHNCKGILIFPILRNTNPDTINKENPIKHWGYFMCMVDDSDCIGRCLFNWYKENNDEKNPECLKFYKETFYRIKLFAKHLGNTETSNIFYNKIINNHIENIAQIEKVKTLTSNSNSTHSIKTMVQGTLRPQATFLLSKLKDKRLIEYQKKYIDEVDELIQFGELINISSKLIHNNNITDNLKIEIISELEHLKIVSVSSSKSPIDLTDIVNRIITLQNAEIDYRLAEYGNAHHVKINTISNKVVAPIEFITFNSFTLTPLFLKLFLTTAIENHFKHGVNKNHFDNEFSIAITNNSIIVTTAKSKKKVETIESIFDKGVFGALNLIFNYCLRTFKIYHKITNDGKHILTLKILSNE